MPSLSKKQVFLAAITAALLLALIAFLTIPTHDPHALQVSILGQTNDASGAPMVIVGVTNHTGQARFFYLGAEVPDRFGWTSANQRIQKTGRLAAHAECRVLLRIPEAAAKWKFRCSSMPEMTKPERLWYLFVRRTGLSRVGFRDQPPASYFSTTEMGL
jgi:hypothetical protein